ncbi:MAG: HAD family hydrolase [Eubacteriaceae bacterium]|nr:HAD family hydrolase [Eubacteriaceae bacterium]
MKNIDTVIFDLDGTLLDTIEDLTDSVNYILAKHIYPTRNIDEIRSFVGNGMRRLIELSAPSGLDEEKIESLFEELKEYYTAHSNIKTKLYTGILELLSYLKSNGYKTAIVSNKNHAAVCELRQIYFNDYIETAIGQKEVIRRKPYADCVFSALESLGCECENAVYIGDSEVDIKTAQNAGMDCIAVSWGFRDKKQLIEAGAQIIADDATEIISILEKSRSSNLMSETI